MVTRLYELGSVEACLVARATPNSKTKVPRPVPAPPALYSPSLKLRLRIILDAARGLERLHQAHIAHNDLAARNLLLDKDWTCALGDFGLATYNPLTDDHAANGAVSPTKEMLMLRVASEPNHATQPAFDPMLLASGGNNSSLRSLRLLPRVAPSCELVSVRHAAPEAIRAGEAKGGSKSNITVSAVAADIWSLAVAAWEVLASAVPYAELANFQVAWSVVEESRRLPMNNDWPKELQAVLQACWNPQRSRPNATQVMRGLEQCLAEVSGSFEPPIKHGATPAAAGAAPPDRAG